MTEKSREDTRRIAGDAGLPRLGDSQLDQFAKGLAATRALLSRLPKDLHWSEEPAVTVSVQPSRRAGP